MDQDAVNLNLLSVQSTRQLLPDPRLPQLAQMSHEGLTESQWLEGQEALQNPMAVMEDPACQ
jgi:hypothetical protein